jgi:Zn-dependent protease
MSDEQDIPNVHRFNTGPLQKVDIEKLKPFVTQYFRVYDIRWSERTAAFYFTKPEDLTLVEDNFESLRLKLKALGFIPRLAVEAGEYIIYILHAPQLKKRSIWVNIILIILTIFTTTWAGSLLWYSRTLSLESEFDIISPLFNPEVVLYGFLSFALPLMLILGTHETAHYMAAKRHKIDASLPYFIPLPPPFILGTMGAFISMREPISNKKALLDIGAAGPIAGFLVSIPVLIVGFSLEMLQPVTLTDLPSNTSVFIFNEPLLFSGLRFFFPSPENSMMHPTAFAGWVGLFVTALNLLPGGQLDGGHIARALLGNNARYLSLMVVISLFVLSFVTQFMLWIIFAFFILLLGTSHPPPLNDLTPLKPKRRAIGAVCMVMLLLCIHYAPIVNEEIPEFEFEFDYDHSQVVNLNGTAVYRIEVTNTADAGGYVEFSYESYSNNTNISDWETSVQLRSSKGKIITDTTKFKLRAKDSFLIIMNITPNENLNYGKNIHHTLFINISSNLAKESSNCTIETHVGSFYLSTSKTEDNLGAGDISRFNISVNNLLELNDTIDFNLTSPADEKTNNWTVSLSSPSVQLGPQGTNFTILSVATPFDAEPGDEVRIKLIGTSKLYQDAKDSLELLVRIN